VLIAAIAISFLLSPLLISVIVLLSDLIGILLPTPDIGGMIFQFCRELMSHTDVMPLRRIVGAVLLAALPGLLLSAAFWLALRRLYFRVAVESVIQLLGARDVDAKDLDEQQLLEAVQALASAVEIPAPRVKIYAGDALNVGVIGRSADNAVLLVSQKTLNALDRTQSRALVGHVVASIANGDLRIAGLVISVLQLYGLVRLLAVALFENHARMLVLRLFRQVFDGAGSDQRGDIDLMTQLVAAATMEETQPQLPPGEGVADKTTWKDALRLPFLATQLLGGMLLPMLTSFMLNPLFGFGLRERRLLADATAAELTGEPEALHAALLRIRETGLRAPGPLWLRHLFVTAGGCGAIASFHPPLAQRIDALEQMGGTFGFGAAKIQPKIVLLVTFVIAPLLMLVSVLMCLALYLIGLLNFLLSLVVLLPVTGVLHLLLRGELWR